MLEWYREKGLSVIELTPEAEQYRIRVCTAPRSGCRKYQGCSQRDERRCSRRQVAVAADDICVRPSAVKAALRTSTGLVVTSTSG